VVAGQFARKRDDGGSMADEEDLFVLPAKAPLARCTLGDREKVPGVVMYEQRGPHPSTMGTTPRINLGKAGLRGACIQQARVEHCPQFDRVVLLG